jgi:hypothetical protein
MWSFGWDWIVHISAMAIPITISVIRMLDTMGIPASLLHLNVAFILFLPNCSRSTLPLSPHT